MKTPGFAISESPAYVARGIAALATADDAERWAGTIISSRQLADAYGVTDTDGSKPDCWGYPAAYGWEREDVAGHVLALASLERIPAACNHHDRNLRRARGRAERSGPCRRRPS